MILAVMIAEDEDAFICDMAQYYHIYDYESMSIDLVVTLSAGLPEESRIKRKLSKQSLTLSELLLASICDSLNLLLWSFSKDGANNRNKPQSVVQLLSGKQIEKKQNLSFKTASDYEQMKARILGRGN